MKKSTKSLLLTALIMFCVGVLLTTVCFCVAYSTKVDVFQENEREFNVGSVSYSLEEMLDLSDAFSADTLQHLSLQMQAADLVFCGTDGETHIEFYNVDQNNLHFSFSAGTLNISEEKEMNRFGFQVKDGEVSFDGLRHLFHRPSTTPTPRVIVYWNPANELSTVRLNATVGSVTVEELPKNASLFSALTYGNISASNLNAPDGAVELRTTVGALSLTDSSFSTAALHTSVGSVSVSAGGGALDASTVVGSLSYICNANIADCRVNATTTFGTVTDFDRASCGAQYYLASETELLSAKLTATVGNIDLIKIGE